AAPPASAAGPPAASPADSYPRRRAGGGPAGGPPARHYLSERALGEAFRRLARLVQGIAAADVVAQLVADLFVKAVLEAFDPVLVRAGEDGHELAVAVVADDVLLPAELGQRLVERAVVVGGLDPV